MEARTFRCKLVLATFANICAGNILSMNSDGKHPSKCDNNLIHYDGSAKKRFCEWQDRKHFLDGIVIDILDSHKIPESEKQSLCKAVDDWLFRNGTFTRKQRGLLYRIRNAFCGSSLYSECEPNTLLDKFLSRVNNI